jgi:uncharacterized protein (AIM24 family)
MATFEIEESQSMRWVRVDLVDDDCRTERGALNHMKGSVVMTVPLPSLRAMWVALFSDESILRPRYEGTGSVYLDSSLGGLSRVHDHPRRTVDSRHPLLLGQ